MIKYTLFFIFFTLITYGHPSKLLICGVGKDVESHAPNTIKNIETLGSHFSDWRAIIYENNSKDLTPLLFSNWAKKNHRVIFLSEHLNRDQIPPSRSEKIARARNIVLAKAEEYSDFDFLIMADLDFKQPWPIQEILEVCANKEDWDGVFANGIKDKNHHYDRYALRNQTYPFGPELFGNEWWMEVKAFPITFEGDEWIPVYSGFGGLAIYKTKSIFSHRYSGVVTEALADYYRNIMATLPQKNSHLLRYLKQYHLLKGYDPLYTFDAIPIFFKHNSLGDCPRNYSQVTCCEHVALHASIALAGHKKFFIYPKMVMQY